MPHVIGCSVVLIPFTVGPNWFSFICFHYILRALALASGAHIHTHTHTSQLPLWSAPQTSGNPMLYVCSFASGKLVCRTKFVAVHRNISGLKLKTKYITVRKCLIKFYIWFLFVVVLGFYIAVCAHVYLISTCFTVLFELNLVQIQLSRLLIKSLNLLYSCFINSCIYFDADSNIKNASLCHSFRTVCNKLINLPSTTRGNWVTPELVFRS